MRQANQAIQREKNPVPTVEETLQEMSTAKVFTKLDLNMTFHQIELSPESRDITTFAAPNGLHRYTRLRSFLGSVQFCAKFIPQFATVSAPL
jgi:hypothetical protein